MDKITPSATVSERFDSTIELKPSPLLKTQDQRTVFLILAFNTFAFFGWLLCHNYEPTDYFLKAWLAVSLMIVYMEVAIIGLTLGCLGVVAVCAVVVYPFTKMVEWVKAGA